MKKRPISLARSVVAALLFLEALQPLSAEAADFVASAQSALQMKLLDPLQQKEADRSRFSRAVSAPQARRIRILDSEPQTDRDGRSFLSFAVDETRFLGIEENKDGEESRWLKDAIIGCVYPETGEVLVRRGEVYFDSSVLLGKQTPVAPADVCRAR